MAPFPDKKDGYYFGRGTQDNKTGAAYPVANFIRLRQDNHVPNRGLQESLNSIRAVNSGTTR